MSGDFAFIPGESFNGAVARWADTVGGLERMIDLTRVAGVRYGHLQRAAAADEAGIRALSSEMGVDADELLSRATPNAPGEYTNHLHPVSFYGVYVPSLLVEKNVRRFSPAGLAASAHHRALWDLRLLPACTVTGEVLLDRCGDPECGKTAWTATLGINRCEHCMTDLTKVKSIRVPEGTREALAEFGGMFSHDPSVRAATLALLPDSVAGLGPANVIDLLLRVIPVVDRAIPTDVANILRAPPPALCAAVAVSWNALKTWPAGLAKIAADRVATRVGRHNDGNDGRTMRFLARRCQVAAPQGVLDLIDDWRRSISVDEAGGAPLLHQTMSGIEVTNATRLETGRLVQYRRAGLFKVHFALDAQRPEARYDAAEIMSMAAVLADRSSIGGARLALGIPSHGVEQLVAMRLLDPLELALVDANFGEQQVSQRSLDALVESISPTPAGANAQDTMTLRAAMKAIGGRIKPWGPVFALLVAGELPIIIDPDAHPLTDAIRIDVDAIPLLRMLSVPEDILAILSPAMSKVDAGELLNLSPVKITALLAHVPNGVGSHSKSVALELVERLAKQHIAVAEIAVRRNVSHLRAHLDAIAACIPHLGVGGFCRTQVEATFFSSER